MVMYLVLTDDPLGGSCSVDEDRDCGGTGCICESFANSQRLLRSDMLDIFRQ